jgi:hypothetical protein
MRGYDDHNVPYLPVTNENLRNWIFSVGHYLWQLISLPKIMASAGKWSVILFHLLHCEYAQRFHFLQNSLQHSMRVFFVHKRGLLHGA